ncbi:hypothetical protein D9619_006093 [Psilocybe cf. subviscida]|uniref:Protein kinase domain-containing protein n=1 Tax=Psilocybe cf. subviscida TaxID=2480587 RepID=A0A8H5B4V3_9AGAR|nr:hypothetical protein D9619_006093 [Psilocybe cf. subviscida]
MQLHDITPFLEHYAPCHVDTKLVNECLENMCSQDEPVIEMHGQGVYRWLFSKCSSRDRVMPIGCKNDMAAGLLQKTIGFIQRNFAIPSCLENRSNEQGTVDVTLTEGFPIEPSSMFGWTSQTDAIVPILGEAGGDDHHRFLAICRHIMDDDPRRKWIYGLTYKDNIMSAWYFSRAHAIGTHPFDYYENPARLVELILSFTSATSSQLGIDPLVRKCPCYTDGLSPSYIYEIPNAVAGLPSVFFKTVRCLYQERRSSVQGRGTRVWEVIQVRSADGLEEVNPEQHAVLKDVWLDADADTEVETMDTIFKAVDDFVEAGLKGRIEEELKKNSNFDCDPIAMQRLLAEFIDMDERFTDFDDTIKRRLLEHLTDKNYRSFFLTPLYAWQGQTSQRGGPNSRFQVPDPPRSVEAPRSVSKRQIRCVFREVCADLRAVGSLGNLMEIINQALDALRILYCVGWVHRDVSKGNLLVVKDASGRWKLKMSDFELSRRSGDGNGCIGTPYFMPYEVLKARHLLHKHRECDVEDSLAVHFNLLVGSPEYNRLKDINKNFCRRIAALPVITTGHIPDYDAPVCYNFQHDLESLWWLVHYCITKWVDHQPSHDYAEFIFQKTFTLSAERNDCFFDNFKSLGGRSLHPKIKVPFSDFMEKLRVAMHEEYVAREAFGQLHMPKSYSYIHNFFAKQLRELLLHHNDDWKAISITFCTGLPKVESQSPLAATKQVQAKAAVRARHKKPKLARK